MLQLDGMSKKMGTSHELELGRAVSAAARKHCVGTAELAQNAAGSNASQQAAQRRAHGLPVTAGAVMYNIVTHRWPTGTTYFLCGDCAPIMERPSPLTYKQVLAHLTMR